MDPNFVAYMRALLCLHMRAPQELHHFTAQEIADSFALLPPPKVSFAEWSVRVGLADAAPASSPMDGKESELNAMLSDPLLAGIVKKVEPDGKG